MPRFLIATGAVSAALSVALGAFAAHGLKVRLPTDILAVFQTGVQYQFYHSLGLILVGILTQLYKGSSLLSGGRPSHGGRYLAILRKPLCHQHDRHPHTGHHHPHRRSRLYRGLADGGHRYLAKLKISILLHRYDGQKS